MLQILLTPHGLMNIASVGNHFRKRRKKSMGDVDAATQAILTDAKNQVQTFISQLIPLVTTQNNSRDQLSFLKYAIQNAQNKYQTTSNQISGKVCGDYSAFVNFIKSSNYYAGALAQSGTTYCLIPWQSFGFPSSRPVLPTSPSAFDSQIVTYLQQAYDSLKPYVDQIASLGAQVSEVATNIQTFQAQNIDPIISQIDAFTKNLAPYASYMGDTPATTNDILATVDNQIQAMQAPKPQAPVVKATPKINPLFPLVGLGLLIVILGEK